MMKFLPIKAMRRVAEMRESVCERIAREGDTPKNLSYLREIYLCEGLVYAEDFTDFYDLAAVTDSIFCAAVLRLALKGIFVFCRVEGRGCYRVNLRLYELAVCAFSAAAENGATLYMHCCENFIKLSIKGPYTNADFRAFEFLGGVRLKRAGEVGFSIFLPLKKSDSTPAQKTKTEYLQNRYSVLNILF